MNHHTVYDTWLDIMSNGRISTPRGEEIKEINYYRTIVDNPWSTYKARKYPMDYFKREAQWYLGADQHDMRITKHAKMWGKITQPDGSIFSNYGHFWFNKKYLNGMSGYDWVVSSLRKDPDSRQAVIPMLGADHIYEGNPDQVCTKGIQFRIVNKRLIMHVDMRSSDAVFGIGTDWPCFSMLHEMIALELGILKGDFIFSADSVHIYERHFEMVNNVIRGGYHEYIPTYIPPITNTKDLINQEFESTYGQWLTKAEL